MSVCRAFSSLHGAARGLRRILLPELWTHLLFRGNVMSLTSLVVFVPLAILCNTVAPVPFDPVLIAFASRESPAAAAILAIVGSVCAGIAAALDLTLFRNLRRRTSDRWVRFLPLWSGRGTYLLTFLF